MINFFAIRSISLFSGSISGCLFICMLYIYKGRKTYPGFSRWTLAFLINFIGSVLLSLRNFLPEFITVILANFLLILFFVVIISGLIDFIGGKQSLWLDIILLLFFIILFLYFSYFSPDVKARIVINSSATFIFCLRGAFISHRKLSVKFSNGNCLLTISFALIALCFFLRIVLSLIFENKINDFMDAGAIHGISIIIASIGHIFIAISLINVNAQRLELDLINAKEEIKSLKGLFPICSNCKKIRDDKGYWNQIEVYIKEHSEAEFSHGICPDCAKKLYPDFNIELP